MGLDQYLYGKKCLSVFEEKEIGQIKEINTILGYKTEITNEGTKDERVNYNSFYPQEIKFEVAYWRKSNQIHAWFVNNCQDGIDECQESYVQEGKLEELLAIIKQVLEDHSLAEKLLPNTQGFFFGGNEYDEWYFEDLKDTQKKLNAILTEDKYKGLEFYYQSSW